MNGVTAVRGGHVGHAPWSATNAAHACRRNYHCTPSPRLTALALLDSDRAKPRQHFTHKSVAPVPLVWREIFAVRMTLSNTMHTRPVAKPVPTTPTRMAKPASTTTAVTWPRMASTVLLATLLACGAWSVGDAQPSVNCDSWCTLAAYFYSLNGSISPHMRVYLCAFVCCARFCLRDYVCCVCLCVFACCVHACVLGFGFKPAPLLNGDRFEPRPGPIGDNKYHCSHRHFNNQVPGGMSNWGPITPSLSSSDIVGLG